MLEGIIDISRYETVINMNDVKNAGIIAMITRCTVGDYYVDPTYYTYIKAGEAISIFTGGYHVLKPSIDITKQIDRFYSAKEAPILGGLTIDFPDILDVELSDGLSANEVTDDCMAALLLMERRSGRKPMWYSGHWFTDAYMNLAKYPEFKDYEYWEADYTTKPLPILPKGLTTFSLWQYTDAGKVPGINGAVDMNRFNGTYEEFLAFIKGGVVVPPPPPTNIVEWAGCIDTWARTEGYDGIKPPLDE